MNFRSVVFALSFLLVVVTCHHKIKIHPWGKIYGGGNTYDQTVFVDQLKNGDIVFVGRTLYKYDYRIFRVSNIGEVISIYDLDVHDLKPEKGYYSFVKTFLSVRFFNDDKSFIVGIATHEHVVFSKFDIREEEIEVDGVKKKIFKHTKDWDSSIPLKAEIKGIHDNGELQEHENGFAFAYSFSHYQKNGRKDSHEHFPFRRSITVRNYRRYGGFANNFYSDAHIGIMKIHKITGEVLWNYEFEQSSYNLIHPIIDNQGKNGMELMFLQSDDGDNVFIHIITFNDYDDEKQPKLSFSSYSNPFEHQHEGHVFKIHSATCILKKDSMIFFDDDDDMFLKYNKNGNLIWKKKIKEDDIDYYNVEFSYERNPNDYNDTIILSGTTKAKVSHGGDVVPFFLMLDKNGDILQSKILCTHFNATRVYDTANTMRAANSISDIYVSTIMKRNIDEERLLMYRLDLNSYDCEVHNRSIKIASYKESKNIKIEGKTLGDLPFNITYENIKRAYHTHTFSLQLNEIELEGYEVISECYRCFGAKVLKHDNTSINKVCSGHGECVSEDTCKCEYLFSGKECEVPVCWGRRADDKHVCHGHGTCKHIVNLKSGRGANRCNCVRQYQLAYDCSVMAPAYNPNNYGSEDYWREKEAREAQEKYATAANGYSGTVVATIVILLVFAIIWAFLMTGVVVYGFIKFVLPDLRKDKINEHGYEYERVKKSRKRKRKPNNDSEDYSTDLSADIAAISSNAAIHDSSSANENDEESQDLKIQSSDD